MKKTFLVATAVVVALGAGCMDRFKPSVQQQPSKIQEAFQSSTTTFGNATTTVSVTSSTTPLVRWDKTSIASKQVSFTPPKNTWVYSVDESTVYQLVPGVVPVPGSPDPQIDVFTRRVAEFYPIERDPTSFPTWDRFELTVAQFACASGDTDATFSSCADKPTNVMSGKTSAGLPYTRFSLASYRKKDNAFMGNHTFFVVRLGTATEHAVFVAVLNEKTGVTPALSLVQSMRIE